MNLNIKVERWFASALIRDIYCERNHINYTVAMRWVFSLRTFIVFHLVKSKVFSLCFYSLPYRSSHFIRKIILHSFIGVFSPKANSLCFEALRSIHDIYEPNERLSFYGFLSFFLWSINDPISKPRFDFYNLLLIFTWLNKS